jgi:hypothetical protein
MCGALPPWPHTSAWHDGYTQGQIYFRIILYRQIHVGPNTPRFPTMSDLLDVFS